MPEPTIQEVFGAGATQDLDSVTILKSDLVGLTATANNKSESIFVGMLLVAMNYLTAVRFNLNPEQSITIEESYESLISRNEQQFRQKTLSVNLHKLDGTIGIDPDDY